MEPFYIRQTSEPMTLDERRKWFRECADEARSQGAKLARASIHPEHEHVCLVEAWSALAHEVGDQGEPRFSFEDLST